MKLKRNEKLKSNKRSLNEANKEIKEVQKKEMKLKRNKKSLKEIRKKFLKKEVICSQSRPIFRLVLQKMCPIFVGSVHNFVKSDDDNIY